MNIRLAWKRKLASLKQLLLQKFWVRLAVNIGSGMGRDYATDMAAAIAYYSLLSVFPLILGTIAVLGIFLPSQIVQRELFTFFETHLPTSVDLLEDNITHVIELRGTLGIISILGLLWGGSAVFGAMARMVNRAWGIHRFRPFVIRKLRDLLLVVVAGTLLLVSFALSTVTNVLPPIDFPAGNVLALLGSKALALLLTFALFLLLYKYIPNTTVYWRDIWKGTLLAAFLFEALRSLFSVYLTHFARYELVYGSIAALIVLLVWIYFSAFIVIFGAEFNSEYAKLRPSPDMDHSRETPVPGGTSTDSDDGPAQIVRKPRRGRLPEGFSER